MGLVDFELLLTIHNVDENQQQQKICTNYFFHNSVYAEQAYFMEIQSPLNGCDSKTMYSRE